MKTISAAEANRQFSTVLREVSQGEEFTVLSRGRSVAAIVPIRKSGSDHKTAKQSLLVRLRKQSITGSREWNRAELYND
jgi:prevent-host-death family protein